MKIRSRTGAAVLSIALCLPLALAAGSPNDRATGGGQVLVPMDGGAGDTIAFTAQNRGDEPTDATGQIQYVSRGETGTGQDQEQSHYRVTCLEVDGDMAYIRGVDRDSGDPVTLFVVDNGEGMAAETDMVLINGDEGDNDENACDVGTDGQMGLTRGNAQVYDASGESEDS